MLLAPALVVVGATLTSSFLRGQRNDRERRCRGTTAGFSAFPFLLPSSIGPNASLTIWGSSSSRLTLLFMLFATEVVMPIILAYTAFVYRVLRGLVMMADVGENRFSTTKQRKCFRCGIFPGSELRGDRLRDLNFALPQGGEEWAGPRKKIELSTQEETTSVDYRNQLIVKAAARRPRAQLENQRIGLFRARAMG
jgi:Cytochrome bd terminal oxidase subunit II